MKKLLLTIFVFPAFLSCTKEKEYTCKCIEYTGGTRTGESTHIIMAEDHGSADMACVLLTRHGTKECKLQ